MLPTCRPGLHYVLGDYDHLTNYLTIILINTQRIGDRSEHIKTLYEKTNDIKILYEKTNDIEIWKSKVNTIIRHQWFSILCEGTLWSNTGGDSSGERSKYIPKCEYIVQQKNKDHNYNQI